MKYLKKFEKSIYRLEPDFIKSEAENYLSYMVDDGFKISSRYSNNSLSIVLLSIINDKFFNWEDYKYDIIQFLQVLKKNYKFSLNINLISESEGIRVRREFLFYQLESIKNIPICGIELSVIDL